MLAVPDQRSEAWFNARRGKITASVAAAILGVGSKGPLSAYNAIMDESPRQEGNWYQRWGTEFEATARAEYEKETGRIVEPTGFWVHDDYPWLGASPDGFIEDGMGEFKCPQNLPEIVPAEHAIQCRVQMMVCDRPWCDYFCWSQKGIFFHRIERDMDRELEIFNRLQAFYEKHLLTKTPPPRRKRRSDD